MKNRHCQVHSEQAGVSFFSRKSGKHEGDITLFHMQISRPKFGRNNLYSPEISDLLCQEIQHFFAGKSGENQEEISAFHFGFGSLHKNDIFSLSQIAEKPKRKSFIFTSFSLLLCYMKKCNFLYIFSIFSLRETGRVLQAVLRL